MEKFERQCQSCGMTLEGGMQAGTESDDSKSLMYCQYCYKDGVFTNPDMTLDEMKNVLDETIGKQGLKGKMFAWLGKKQLPSLKRWKQ